MSSFRSQSLVFPLQSLAPEILHQLLTCRDPAQVDATVGAVIARIGQASGAGRVLVMGLDRDHWSCRWEWHTPGLAPALAGLQDLPRTAFPHETEASLAGQAVTPGPTATLPPGPLRDLLLQLEIARMIALPFTADPGYRGALILGLGEGAAPPAPEAMRLLSIIADGINALLGRHRAEAALAASLRERAAMLARRRATLSATADLLLEIDDAGRCFDIQCSRPDLLSAPPEMILGRTLEEVLPPDIAALQRQAMVAARRDGVAEVPLYHLGEGAARRWFQLTVARREAVPETGSGAGFVFRIRDMTDERTRARSERFLAGIVAELPLLVALTGADMRIKWTNRHFEEQFGTPGQSLIGQPIRAFTDLAATSPEFLTRIRHAYTHGLPFQGVACRLIHGARRWTDVILRPYSDPDGDFSGFISIERDVTERVLAEAETARMAAEAEAARSRLHTAIETLDDGIVMFDPEGRLVLSNSRFQQIHAPISDLIAPGLHVHDLIREGRARGLYAMPAPDLPGLDTPGPYPQAAGAGHPPARRTEEIGYADGRTYRLSVTRAADGGVVALHTDITALKDAHQRLSDVIDGARIATWDLDLVTGVTTVNRHWRAMLGLPADGPDQITTEEWINVCHPDSAAEVAAQIEDARSGRADGHSGELKLRHRNGSTVHVIARGRVVARGPGGEALRMSGVDIDITQRRQVEDRLQTILDSSSVGTWQLDVATGETLIDESYARLLGYRLPELQPLTRDMFERMLHPDDLGPIYDRVREATRLGTPWVTHEFRMRHRDGSWRWILSKTRILEWAADGSGPLRESGVHIDITEARAREAALAEARDALSAEMTARLKAERRMADIAAVSDDWFWEQDTEARFTYVSEGFERSTGLTLEQVLGRNMAELRDFGVGASVSEWERMYSLFAVQARFTDFLCWYRPPDQPGETFWARISGAPFFDSAGEFAGYRGVAANVRTLIEATERAEAASRAKSQFLATMSHELRTPLTAVLGLTELMLDKVAEPDLRGMLDTIRESGTGLLAVLDDILDLAKIEAGKLVLDPAPFVPADLARRCEALFRPRAEASGLELSVTAAEGCAQPRLGDANRILQILNNLIGNAVKFTERGGVRVRMDAPEPELLRFEIEDDGIGMSEDQLARVFDEFEQAEGSTARRFGGTGLGLPITRRLVQLLGGTMELDSTPEHGTRVAFSLPLPVAPPAAPAAPAAGTAELAGLRVLVADDNQTNRRILDAMLTGLGLAVTLAEDGRAALAQYRPGAYDLLLLDISMPGLDGPAALAAIQAVDADAGTAAPPALAVTAHAMAHQVREFLDAGFAGHIAKPFSRASLAEALLRHRPPVG